MFGLDLTLTDFVLLAALALGVVWVVYGALKRVIVFMLLSVVILALLACAGYVQTGKFSGGFLGEKSAIVRMVGQVLDGCRQGVF